MDIAADLNLHELRALLELSSLRMPLSSRDRKPRPVSGDQFINSNKWWPKKSCKLHFQVAPLKIVRGSKQYIYDDNGIEYLDCINNVSHVGHCHPYVVAAGQEQMAKLTTCAGFLSDPLVLYATRLIETLPERLSVCYFVNSGSEANDLALRLAHEYTKQQDIVVVDNAFHGNLGNLLDISPLRWNVTTKKKDHVHVVPCPDTFRGKHRSDDPDAINKYLTEAQNTIQKARSKGRKIGAFIVDPLMTSSGLIKVPHGYVKNVYAMVREAGGVCISDEVQVGLGRVGDHFWGFQCQDVIPDILTCGKPLGNGHPMAVVVTTKEIADSFGEFSSSFGGNPVSCAIGLAVMDVIKNEQLMSGAKFVGRTLVEGFRNIQDKHPMMGQVRGQGMVVGVEIITNKESRKPAKEAAELLSYKMKEEKVIIANEGPDKNVMLMLPPLCFTCENAGRVVAAFDKCLAEIENGLCPENVEPGTAPISTTQLSIPMDILDPQSGATGGMGSNGSDNEQDLESWSPDSKRAKYDYDDVD